MRFKTLIAIKLGVIAAVFFSAFVPLDASAQGSPHRGESSSGSGFSFKGVKNLLFIFDASKSMSEPISLPEGKIASKIDCAKVIVQRVIASLSPSVKCGLRVYGQDYVEGKTELNCAQSSLLVPLATKNKRAVVEQLLSIKATGMSPFIYALEKAWTDDLRDVQDQTVVFIITDGKDSCGRKPEDFKKTFLTSTVSNKKLVVLSMAQIGKADDLQAIRDLALSTGGQVYDYRSVDEFLSGVKNARVAQ